MKVTVGVTGGIAAYKAAELVRALQRRALEVRVVMTQAAMQFIQPLTFQSLTGHKVQTGLWGEVESQSSRDRALSQNPSSDSGTSELSSIEHIAEAQWADALVVAPATANVLAKFAHGIADDFLTTMYLATTAPTLVAPAMNVNMWRHAATQANLQLLEQRGVRVLTPGSGYLACGMTGDGRMAEPEAIAEAVLALLQRRNDLAGEVVLVTAGGTREAIDPVRFLGNRSSGKMGYAIAEAAQARGARVILVSGPTALRPPAGCEFVSITTAEEMRGAVLQNLPEATLVIKSAAVADYRPVVPVDHKIKRVGPLTLELVPTEDILAEVVEKRRSGTLVIGFAAETENPLEQGRAKLFRKGVDAIVVNDVSRPGLGFDAENNAATFLTTTTVIDLPEMNKRRLADRILDEVIGLRRPQSVLSESGAGRYAESRE